ncbi:class I SAM-dependent methyltransferase [Nesterenkonia sp. K-15-9-6]|uniref:class I SAM-dependent methyltransferase n=1 Tax=Nesterenkonia sp. K-15-9-6 TaxID=3093918 RepID=UPI0040444E1A
MHAADFYTGLVAEMYAPLKGESFDAGPYAEFIRVHGQPALELGCGDGEPMLELLQQGLDVDGVDSSLDMLARFRAAAEIQGSAPRLYAQRMEELDLPRQYRSIFLAGPTILLLPDDAAVVETLRRLRQHLVVEGAALVPLWIPEPAAEQEIGQVRQTVDEDGAVLRLTLVSQERDDRARTQRTLLRYERRRGHDVEVDEREWLLHWHTHAGFVALAEQAGLRASLQDGEPDDIPGTGWSVLLTHC